MYTENDYRLCHHGIRGQSWGEKNGPPYPLDKKTSKEIKNGNNPVINKEFNKGDYINKDGSLTEKGKVVYKRLIERQRNDPKRDTRTTLTSNMKIMKKLGVHSQDDFTDILNEGSKLNRYAYSNETLDDKRKYVSLTKQDDAKYWEEWGKDTPFERRKDLIKDIYINKTDIKIATGAKVLDELISLYGNEPINDVYIKNYRDYIYSAPDLMKQVAKPSDKMTDSEREDRRAEIAVSLASDKALRNLTMAMNQKVFHGSNSEDSKDIEAYNKFVDRFKDQGYDAIVDVEDYYNWTQYPLIVLNPSKTLSLKKHKRVY